MSRLVLPSALAAAVCAAAACSDAPTATRSAAPGTPALNVVVDENFNCIGRFTGGRYANVFVPEGRSCTLAGATVSGSVLAREGSRLILTDTRVDGNVDGVKAAAVRVTRGSLGGSIQISEGTSPGEVGALVLGTILTQGNIEVTKMQTGTVRIEGARLDKGNIKVENNAPDVALAVVRNIVAQNIDVISTQGSAPKTVRNNTVRQKLLCKENALPFVGGPNPAAAERAEQCF